MDSNRSRPRPKIRSDHSSKRRTRRSSSRSPSRSRASRRLSHSRSRSRSRSPIRRRTRSRSRSHSRTYRRPPPPPRRPPFSNLLLVRGVDTQIPEAQVNAAARKRFEEIPGVQLRRLFFDNRRIGDRFERDMYFELSSPDEATTAISSLGGRFQLLGQELNMEQQRVKPHEPFSRFEMEPRYETELDERATRTLFVGNLPADITREDIEKHFARYGKAVCWLLSITGK